MKERFVMVEVSVRVGIVTTYAAGLWCYPDGATGADALRIAKNISSAVLSWHEVNVPPGEGKPVYGHRARPVRIPPEKVEWARKQCSFYPEDSPRRFLHKWLLDLYVPLEEQHG